MQEDGKGSTEVSLWLSRQPYNTTLSFQGKPILRSVSSVYTNDYNRLTQESLHLIMLSQPYQSIIVGMNAPL